MPTLDLTQLDWTVSGWRPFVWRFGKSRESGGALTPDLGPFPATIPGSVQQNLLRAGVIEDWNIGVNSRACEWVEHRHWDFSANLAAGAIPKGEHVVLEALGLDYSGWVLVDCKEVARFVGALFPQRFDLTEALNDGQAHQISLMFEEPPREQGQFGYTSLSNYFKPRYGYSWDWCPRIVPIGVWDALTLRIGPHAAFDVASVKASLASDNRIGRLEAEVEVEIERGVDGAELSVAVTDGDETLTRTSTRLASGSNHVALDGLAVEAWWPNGHGAQKLYTVTFTAYGPEGATLWTAQRRVGFRRIEWAPCDDAPAGAEPWICVVNGKSVFLQGANWVPPRAVYPDSTVAEYRQLIGLYRDMGCTCLRVWGGGILETEAFYANCDESGILVWQEFPLSSSGVDNAPPGDSAAIEILSGIARSYIRRRAHHASLILWCGGNELQVKTDEGEVPVDYLHPCIAALRAVVWELDPDTRFIPTSASGPTFYAHKDNFGKGVHHDVHGPWGMGGFADLQAWQDYWDHDDALFRSEVGMPGAANADHIQRYAGAAPVWLPEGEYWQHTAAWWIQWDRYQARCQGKTLADYVQLTQQDQATAYAAAARACKNRFPKCGGFIIWMGHDCYPCPVNNSVIDFDRNPKPAYYALQKVFRATP